MQLTKQTILVSPVMPGYTGNGSIDPFPLPHSAMQEFSNFVQDLVNKEKTDGIQYSVTLGTSIRRWADEETAMIYKNYVNSVFQAFEIPTENQTFVIEDLVN